MLIIGKSNCANCSDLRAELYIYIHILLTIWKRSCLSFRHCTITSFRVVVYVSNVCVCVCVRACVCVCVNKQRFEWTYSKCVFVCVCI